MLTEKKRAAGLLGERWTPQLQGMLRANAPKEVPQRATPCATLDLGPAESPPAPAAGHLPLEPAAVPPAPLEEPAPAAPPQPETPPARRKAVALPRRAPPTFERRSRRKSMFDAVDGRGGYTPDDADGSLGSASVLASFGGALNMAAAATAGNVAASWLKTLTARGGAVRELAELGASIEENPEVRVTEIVREDQQEAVLSPEDAQDASRDTVATVRLACAMEIVCFENAAPGTTTSTIRTACRDRACAAWSWRGR